MRTLHGSVLAIWWAGEFDDALEFLVEFGMRGLDVEGDLDVAPAFAQRTVDEPDDARGRRTPGEHGQRDAHGQRQEQPAVEDEGDGEQAEKDRQRLCHTLDEREPLGAALGALDLRAERVVEDRHGRGY